MTDKTFRYIKEPGSTIKVIRPDDRMRQGVFVALRHLLKEIWLFRRHIWTVFRQDFRSAYYGSGLGVFWNFVLPILPLTVYLFLTRLRVFPNFEGVNSATFLTFGVTLWFLLVGCIQIPIQTIQARNKEVMKTAFPLSAAIVSAFARLFFDTLVRIAFVIAVIVATSSWPVWTALALPLILLPAILLFIGVGLLFGILNVIYKDVSRVVIIFLQYGIFVSGVIFPIPKNGLLATLDKFNPFAVFIDASRGVVFRGGIEDPAVFTGMVVLSVVVFLVASRIFYVMEFRVRSIS